MLQVSAVAGLGNLEMGSPAVGLLRLGLAGRQHGATRQRAVGVKHPGTFLGLASHSSNLGLGWAPATRDQATRELALNWNLRGQNASVLQVNQPFVYLCQLPAVTVQ